MSLKIGKNWENDRKWYKTRKKPITVYKHLSLTGTSTFRAYPWKHGENVSSRISPDVMPREVSMGYVFKGFHFYTRKDDAYLKIGNCTQVVKCLVQPEDIVAVGTFMGKKMLVATKAEMLGQVRRRPGRKQ